MQVFVIMLAQQKGGVSSCDTRARGPFFGVVVGFLLLATLALQPGDAGDAASLSAATGGGTPAPGDVITVGVHLLTQYVVGVEITGVLLLAAMVGAIAIAARKVGAGSAEVD